MTRRDLNHTINRRAMAGIIVALSVEIAARRDTSINRYDRHVLALLVNTYGAYMDAWQQMEGIDPLEYVEAWDAQAAGLRSWGRFKVRHSVARATSRMSESLADMFTYARPNITAHERNDFRGAYRQVAIMAAAA